MWQQLLDYFGTLEQRPLERMLFLVAGMLVLWLIEGAIPLVSLRYKKINYAMLPSIFLLQ